MRHELFPRVVAGDGLISASEFVRTAEDGSIGEIDRWVVLRAIEVAAAGRPVHVHLSQGATDDAILELIRERFELTGAEAGGLVLELSERQLIAAPDQCRDFMRTRSSSAAGSPLTASSRAGPTPFSCVSSRSTT
jgi:EAL domain-containing protein (putative c-di-GMP-specific phosphodiesterase class I)